MTPPRFALLVALGACGEDPAPPSPPAATPVRVSEDVPPSSPRTAGPPVTHALRFEDRANHLLDVTSTFPAGGDTLTVWMPTWTPGSYFIREFARHVEGLEARGPDGAPLVVTGVAKNRWSIATGGATAVTVRYRLYAREPSVRTNFVDGDLAVLNGAATFLAPDDGATHPHRVVAHLPDGWAGAWTGLDPTPGGGPTDWTAADLDELIDSPIVLGDATVRSFEVGGVPHRLVLAGDTAPWDVDRSAADVETLVRAQQALWGTVPYASYTFLNVINESGGGLEHLDSTLMMAGRWSTATREAYVKWLGLVSHEFFHTWNVKRLRPAALGPFDYEHEVTTPSLWIAEGLTSYYDDLLLVRAGLITEAEYLARVGDQVGRLMDTPGRRVRTLEQASADAWIKHYRHDENTVNTDVSYYLKGMAVGWLLDAEVRRATDDTRSLDDVMRTAFARHAGARGYTPAEFEAVVDEEAGRDLGPFLDRALRTTEELDPAPALAWWGLRWTDPDAAEDDATTPKDPPAGWLGAAVDAGDGRPVITEIKRGTPAFEAGLQVGDELVALDDWRLPREGLGPLLALHPPGTAVRLAVSRRGRLRTVPVTLGAAPKARWGLEVDPAAPAEAVARRRAWLGLPSAPAE
jgi:predicted metalloprotease with PDZ domain